MMSLFRSIKADFYKLRHTPVLWIHLLIPFIGAVVFLAYYAISSWSVNTKISAYFETLAIVFPLLIGVICSMVVSQEEQAGNFQELIARTKWRGTAFFSKILVLILGALVSIVIALTVFGMGFQYVLQQQNFPISCYVKVAIGLLVGNLFLYIIHLYLSLKFGKGASIGLGIVGSVISAIMLTGLGDRIWKATPWAWGGSFCDFAVLKQINTSVYNMVQGEVTQGIIIMIIESFIALLLVLFWFCRFEGRKSCE